MINPFLKFIELKRLEAQIKKDLPIAKQEAIAYYESKPVLTGEKTTGQFSEVDGEKLPAKLTWKVIETKIENPVYTEKVARLAEIENSLKVIHAEKISEFINQIAAINNSIALLLENEETKSIKESLKEVCPTIKGEDAKELSVTLPK